MFLIIKKKKNIAKKKKKQPPCPSSPEHESAQGFMSSSSQLVEAHFALHCPFLPIGCY